MVSWYDMHGSFIEDYTRDGSLFFEQCACSNMYGVAVPWLVEPWLMLWAHLLVVNILTMLVFLSDHGYVSLCPPHLAMKCLWGTPTQCPQFLCQFLKLCWPRFQTWPFLLITCGLPYQPVKQGTRHKGGSWYETEGKLLEIWRNSERTFIWLVQRLNLIDIQSFCCRKTTRK